MDRENDIATKGVDDGTPAVIDAIGESEPIGAPPVKPPKKRKSNAIFIVLGLIVIALCVGANYLLLDLSTNAKYFDAKELYAEGYYADAQMLFEELGDYKNAAEWITITKYASAISQYESGDYLGAMDTFQALGSYADSLRWTIASQYQYGLTLLSEGDYARAREHLVIASEYEDTEALIQSCDYAIAIQTLEEGDYTTAITMLEELGEYEGSDTLVRSSTYSAAIQLLEEGNYTAAITLFETLGEYEDAADYINTAKDASKYELLKEYYFDIEDTAFYEMALSAINKEYTVLQISKSVDKEKAEQICGWWLYEPWYSADGNENLVIDEYQINGREYALEYVQDGVDPANMKMLYLGYFLDNPDDQFVLYRCWDLNSLYDYSEVVGCLYFFERSDGGVMQLYRDVTENTYQSIVEEYEISIRTPNYSDSEVIKLAREAFIEMMLLDFPNTYVFESTIEKFTDGYVEYDRYTETYTCSMTATFSGVLSGEAILEYRSVKAIYQDTGSGLTMTYFWMQ